MSEKKVRALVAEETAKLKVLIQKEYDTFIVPIIAELAKTRD